MKSLRDLLNLGTETTSKCSDLEHKKSLETSYHIYKTWLKNESPEVQAALQANKPFLKKFFADYDSTFCKHPKPIDPLGGKLMKVNFGGEPHDPAITINKAKIDEKLNQFNERSKDKMNSIKQKFNSFKQQCSQPPPPHTK